MLSVNGVGRTFYGEIDKEPDGSYTTTKWVILVYLPTIPLGSYRIITKGLFDAVQFQLKSSELKTRREKEFAFTRIMTCGLCGLGISADEKYKKLKNGKINAHIYYGCTKARDKNCKCGYLNEVDLIKQLQGLVDNVDLNQSTIGKRVPAEVSRYKKFTQSLLGEISDISTKDIDVKDYVKFLLKEGSLEEKRGVMNCFKLQVISKEKKILLKSP